MSCGVDIEYSNEEPDKESLPGITVITEQESSEDFVMVFFYVGKKELFYVDMTEEPAMSIVGLLDR